MFYKEQLGKDKEAMEKMMKLIKVFLAIILLISINSCKEIKKSEGKEQDENITYVYVNDSILLKSVFYPERWAINNDSLWVVNSRDSIFLKAFDLSSGDCMLKWGHLGNGPDDYVSPGLIENFNGPGVGIYGNTEQRIVRYIRDDNEMKATEKSSIPVKSEDMRKPYTRIFRINDSIMTGSYFLPKTVGVDIFNTFTDEIISEFIPDIGKNKEDMSGPFEFKIAANDTIMVIAYRYLDLIEFLPFSDDFIPERSISIGSHENQKRLYEEDRDDEMIKYYSDIQISDGYVYALYQGEQERNLSSADTKLKIYDLNAHKLVRIFVLGRFFDQLLLRDNGDIILYSPENEDYLFKLTI